MENFYEIPKNSEIQFLIAVRQKSNNHVNKRHTNENYHSHSHYEITHLDSDDENLYYIDGRVYHVDSNSIMLASPGIRHITSRRYKHVPRIIINFKREYVAEFKDFCGIDVDKIFQNLMLVFSDSQMLEIKNLAYQMHKEYQNNSQSPHLRLLLANFLDLLSSPLYVPEPSRQDEPATHEILRYIQANYFKDISLGILSKIFFQDIYKLCRDIKKCTGMTFSDFLTLTRLNHARDMLENSDTAVTHIAENVGYNSQTYFSTAFKRYTGLSPTDYRQRFKSCGSKSLVFNLYYE